jgi:hypothetical protein
MSNETVNELVTRLMPAAPFSAEHFAALLGVSPQPGVANPAWRGYTFALPAGPFAGGELRLNTGGDGALLILEPRQPAGLGLAEVDRAAWGPRRSVRPSPDIPPEGTVTETYQTSGTQVAVQWTLNSRRLVSLTLEWPIPQPAAPT